MPVSAVEHIEVTGKSSPPSSDLCTFFAGKPPPSRTTAMEKMNMRIRLLILLSLLCLTACTSQATDPTVFDVNLVVLTKRPEALQRATPDQMRREVDILNTYFVGADGVNPVRFRFKNLTYAHEIAGGGCPSLSAMGDLPREYDHRQFKTQFDDCRDGRLVDPGAINFYVYDSYSDSKSFGDRTSHGHNHGDRPFLLLDWERIGHRIQSPEEHEMGHAFGLAHVCAVGADQGTSTNIMASRECGLGSGGRRDVGFDAEQLRIIKKRAEKIDANLRRMSSGTKN